MTALWLFLKTFILIRWFPAKNRAALLRRQQKALAAQKTFFRLHLPYLQNGGSFEDIKMDKALMMARFDDLNTVDISKDQAMKVALEAERTRDFSPTIGRISVGLSSGTSGHRGLFLTSPEEQAMWAGAVLAKMLPRGRCFGQRIAFFLRANNNLYQTLDSPLLSFRFFDMETPLAEHLAALQNAQPSILVAPASVLARLAAYQEQGRLNIAPQKIIAVAEVLETRDADYIAAVFRLPFVDQIYQATEGFLAATCRCGTLHLNEDIVQIAPEWLDDTRFIPVITDLKRRSQAFVNYRLNDILHIRREACPCGSPHLALAKIEGRSDDVFVFRNRAGETVEIYPDFIRRCILFIDGIREYQVCQTGGKTIEIAVSGCPDGTQNAIVAQFEKLMAQHGIAGTEYRFVPYRQPEKRKLKRIERKT
ncbi:F390 synthetase-related protein [Kingella oralis]|jgi:probable adenylate-forming enzyme|uniref:F390 synthetase-related protein n=1 Tax=Kingella oralis TaxID=505 RepID=UPI0034E39A79